MRTVLVAAALAVVVTACLNDDTPSTATEVTDPAVDELCELADKEAEQIDDLDGGERVLRIADSEVVDYLDEHGISAEALAARCPDAARAWSEAVRN